MSGFLERYRAHLGERAELIEAARLAAHDYAELIAGDRRNDYRYMSARAIPATPVKADDHDRSVTLDANEVSFTLTEYRRGDVEDSWFSVPLAFIDDPERFAESYLAERRREEEAKCAVEAEQQAKHKTKQELLERERLRTLLARYGHELDPSELSELLSQGTAPGTKGTP